MPDFSKFQRPASSMQAKVAWLWTNRRLWENLGPDDLAYAGTDAMANLINGMRAAGLYREGTLDIDIYTFTMARLARFLRIKPKQLRTDGAVPYKPIYPKPGERKEIRFPRWRRSKSKEDRCDGGFQDQEDARG